MKPTSKTVGNKLGGWRARSAAVGLFVLVICATASSARAADPSSSPAWFERNSSAVESFTEGNDSPGYFWDEAERQYVVRVTPGAAAEIKIALATSRMSAPVRFASAVASKTAVDATLALLGRRGWHPAAKKYSLGFYYDALTDRTVVVTDAPGVVIDSLKAQAKTPIEIKRAELQQHSRYNDGPPGFGGASIANRRTSSVCTSGFAVKDYAGREFMVTAGHCGSYLDSFASGTFNYGSMAHKAAFPQYDLALLQCPCGAFAAEVYVGNESSSIVRGSLAATVGATNYYTSGQTTGLEGGRTIRSTSATMCTNIGCTPGLISFNGGEVNEGGDSGAPLFKFADGRAYISGVYLGGGGGDKKDTTTRMEAA